MKEFHHIRIITEPRGYRCRIELDGQELRGVTACIVRINSEEHTQVSLTMVPQIVEIDGSVDRDYLDIDRAVRLAKIK